MKMKAEIEFEVRGATGPNLDKQALEVLSSGERFAYVDSFYEAKTVIIELLADSCFYDVKVKLPQAIEDHLEVRK